MNEGNEGTLTFIELVKWIDAKYMKSKWMEEAISPRIHGTLK